MLRRVLVVVAVVLASVTFAGLTLGAHGGDLRPQTTPEGFASTEFNVRVYENGSARWTIEHSKPLLNESQVANFRDFAASFTEGRPRTVEVFERNSRWTVDNVSATLGRPMEATNFDHGAEIQRTGNPVGVMRLSYTWTNFARIPGDTVVVDDVFESGMYIADNQRLVFEPGPGLVFVAADPRPTSMAIAGNLTASDSLTWLGEKRFSNERPSVTLAPPASSVDGRTSAPAGSTSAPAPTTARSTTPGGGDAPGGDGGLPMGMMALAIVLVIGLGGGLAWYAGALPRRRDGGDATAAEPGPTTEPAPAGEPSVAEEELLSDEDRVLTLLQDNGGRMKQVDIVDETDWSKSKVSMLLSDMEEEGTISKLRVGRENIISLAGQEPDAAGSPFDEE